MRHFSRCLAVTFVPFAAAVPLGAQTLRSAAFGDRGASIELYADANLKSLLAQNTGGNPQSAAGSLGLAYRTESVLAQLLVNVVGQSESVRRNFGATLLPPASGSSLGAGLLDLAFRIGSVGSLCQGLVLHAYGSVGSAKWVDEQPGLPDAEYGVITGGAGGALRCLLFSGALSQDGGSDGGEGRRAAAYFEVGPSFRTVGGEIASADNESVRERLLGTTDKPQWGVEASLGLEINGVKGGLTYYGFWNDVPGMSDGQVVAGFSVQSALLTSMISRPSSGGARRRR